MGTVHLHPVEGASIYPYPAEEMDVDEELAAELLAYSPPAFTADPPPKPKKPRKAASQQPEGPSEQDGSSDSGEVAS